LKCHGCCRFDRQQTIWAPQLLGEERSSSFYRDKSFEPVLISSSKYNFACPFLNNGNNRCSIYRQRPFECRLYPFLVNKIGKRLFLAVDLHCDFIKRNFEAKKLKRYTAYLIKITADSLFKRLLRKNFSASPPYPQVLNIAELKF
jgi:Fe-S-cluster containining protein